MFSMMAIIALGLVVMPIASATNYEIGFPILNTNSQGVPAGTWIIQTNQDYNLAYDLNSGFIVQDIQQALNITFKVTSGSLYGTGNLNVTTGGGIFTFIPTTTGDLTITATISSFYCLVNGQPLSNPFTFQAGTQYLIFWQYSNAPPPFIVGNNHSVLYFRSDSYTTNNVTAYGLDTTNTNQPWIITTPISTPNQPITYGFRVWLTHSHNSQTELTAGIPTATITRTTDGSGFQNNTWLCPDMPLSLGSEAIKVIMYVSLDGSNTWHTIATYTTHALISPELLHQTWTFIMYTTYSTITNQATAVFGSNT